MGAFIALLALGFPVQAKALPTFGPLRLDPDCAAFDLVRTRGRWVYPYRACKTFEVSADVGVFWTRRSSRRAPRGGLVYELSARYRARIPLVLEISVSPGMLLFAPRGSLSSRGVRFGAGLDLRGLGLGISVGRVWLDSDLAPTTAESTWVGELRVRIGASDGLALRVRVRRAPGRPSGSALESRAVPEVSVQIPLYPSRTLLKHFLYLGLSDERRRFVDVWLGTAHQVVRRSWGTLFLRFAFHGFLDTQVDDDAWIGRSFRVGLEWRGPNRGRWQF